MLARAAQSGVVDVRQIGVVVSDGTGLTEEQVWVAAVATVSVAVAVGTVITVVRAVDLLLDLGLGALFTGTSSD